jgi:hypothetical protein
VAIPTVALATRPQLFEGVKAPVELVVKLTLPVGVMSVPSEVSLTVAVQFVDWVTVTGVLQLTAVDVARLLTVRVNAVVVALPV